MTTGYAQVRAVATQAGYDQIYVDGVNVTYFRGVETPPPDYLLTEPFAYGPTTLSLPQVDAGLDELGVGELSWIREDAPVVIQRVDDPTAETPIVLATDYRGFVSTIVVDGRNLSLEIGGEFSGPASMVNKQKVLVRRVGDVGYWVSQVLHELRLTSQHRRGPVTGIKIPDGGGGGTLLAWASDLCAWSQTNAGVQRTIMPTVWGGNVWGFAPKDTTTRHVTLFTDDARVVPRLRRDRTEQPNRWFGTCITPDGVRVNGSRYPGIFQGPAPEFPGSMSLGDTDADTTTGDGVTVLNIKLRAMGYQDPPTDYTTFSADTEDGVKNLQRDVGVTVNGTVNLATWRRLFDVDATGYSLVGAEIFPIAQDTAVRQFDHTGNGSVAGRNPGFDASVRPVDRNIDFGPDVTEKQMHDWILGQKARLEGTKNWAGDIVLNGGFGGFAGDWDTSDADYLNDPATGPAHIMSQLDIRPGMNAWLPMFDGGTLVHIAGVQVSRVSRTVTLTVDTLARDLLELAAIKARNKEARRSIRREWYAENRPQKASGAMVTRDKWFGLLDRDKRLTGHAWNVFAVVAGQHGQVNRVSLRTVNHKATFAVAVFATHVTEKRLNRRVGNPLTVVGGESVWEKESLQDWYEDRSLLYAVGDENQPCGYFPRRFKGDNNNPTGAPITGRHVDDANFSYICAPGTEVLLYVAVYPDRDCTLKKGQLFWAQEDDAV